MATSKVQSFADGLMDIQGTLGRMRMAPDADQAFIEDLTKVITAKAQQGQQQQQQQQEQMKQALSGGMGATAGPGGQQAPGGGSPNPVAGPGQGGPPTSPPQPGGGNPNTPPGPGGAQTNGINPSETAGRGMQARPDMPNPDELRRYLQSQAGG